MPLYGSLRRVIFIEMQHRLYACYLLLFTWPHPYYPLPSASFHRARLHDVQRKRVELERTRHPVRNYNDVEE